MGDGEKMIFAWREAGNADKAGKPVAARESVGFQKGEGMTLEDTEEREELRSISLVFNLT